MSGADGVAGAVEALLFVSDEPVTASRLASVLDAPVATVEKTLRGLAESYAKEERGFQLR